MSDVDFGLVDLLLEWDVRLETGDHSLDDWALGALAANSRDPKSPSVLFYAPRGKAALRLALEAGLDLVQRRPNGDTVLFETDLYDLQAFEYVADALAAINAIDLTNSEGMTALSSQVKFGEIEKARVLLERGASPNAVMQNSRYGGVPLSVAMQAVMVMPASHDADLEDLSIRLLALLKKHGLNVAPDEKEGLLLRAKPRVKKWIADQL